MKEFSPAEILLVKEVTKAAQETVGVKRGLDIGFFIKLIRMQLGMSQQILSRRSGVPQATISLAERGKRDIGVDTLNKILSGLFCDLVMAPLLHESIDVIRHRQARQVAEKRVRYLIGTMNLEEQQPDAEFLKELVKKEERNLLQGPNNKLWEV